MLGEEIQSTETKNNLGGSQTETTEYSYEKKWLDYSPDSSSFKEKSGYENLSKEVSDYSNFAKNLKIGSYSIVGSDNPNLHKEAMVNLSEVEILKGEVSNNFLFVSRNGSSNVSNPKVGDYRISYSGVELGQEMTFIGSLRGGELRSHTRDPKAFDLYQGDKEDAYGTARGEDDARLWGLRFLGFFMMTFGIFLVVSPFTVFLDVIPFLGNASRFLVFVASVLIAFVISLLTILISIILNNPIVLLIIIAVATIVIFYFFRKRKS